jgi:hypothetical protein
MRNTTAASQPPGKVSTSHVGPPYFRPDNLFFLFSAHRFFIITDNRLRPAAVRWWRFLAGAASFLADTFVATARVEFAPSNAAIALSRRSLSAFNSETIRCVSKLSSYFGPCQAHAIVAELCGEWKLSAVLQRKGPTYNFIGDHHVEIPFALNA